MWCLFEINTSNFVYTLSILKTSNDISDCFDFQMNNIIIENDVLKVIETILVLCWILQTNVWKKSHSIQWFILSISLFSLYRLCLCILYICVLSLCFFLSLFIFLPACKSNKCQKCKSSFECIGINNSIESVSSLIFQLSVYILQCVWFS